MPCGGTRLVVFHGGTFLPLPINGDGERRPKEQQLDLTCFELKRVAHPLESGTNSDITWPLDESLLRND